MNKTIRFLSYLKINYKMTIFSLLMIYINMFLTIIIFGDMNISVFNSYFAFSTMAFIFESYQIIKRRKEGSINEKQGNKKRKKTT